MRNSVVLFILFLVLTTGAQAQPDRVFYESSQELNNLRRATVEVQVKLLDGEISAEDAYEQLQATGARCHELQTSLANAYPDSNEPYYEAFSTLRSSSIDLLLAIRSLQRAVLVSGQEKRDLEQDFERHFEVSSLKHDMARLQKPKQ